MEQPPGAGGLTLPPGRSWAALWTVLVGLAVTAALVWISQDQYASNEQRLLALRARDLAALFTEAVPDIQTTLASAAELADVTHGDPARFAHFMGPYVGTAPGKLFVSASLWKLGGPQKKPEAVVGSPPELGALPGRADAFFDGAGRTTKLAVIGLLGGARPRLGYEFNTPDLPGGYAAYGESALPAHRRAPIQRGSAFAGLDYALYLGPRRRPAALLATSQAHLPLRGRMSVQTIPFGNTTLTLSLASRHSLGGATLRVLPWLVAIIGTLVTAAAAAGVLRLVQRRRGAELLATQLEATAIENRRLYAEQRNIAQTLQHALLPERLPSPPGVTARAIYQPGVEGVEVGGDWYEVLELDGRRLLLVVGDVSGRGLRAATTMAALRHAIRAYAAQGDPPGQILRKVSRLLSVAESGQLATILCAVIDPPRRRITLSTAGHLPPLLIDDGDSRFLETEVGLPIGVEPDAEYIATELAVPAAATLIAFTDGLIERRGESLDNGLARLRTAVRGRDLPLPDLLRALVDEMPPVPSEDDIAIVGLSWTS